jgi:hypothetical protein
MRSRREDRAERRLLRQLSKELSTLDGFGRPPKPPHRAKDFLGAIVTLAIVGMILLQVTNALASRCEGRPNPRRGPVTCSGLPAVAEHAHGPMTVSVAVCAGLAVLAFTWYMLWGYKTGAPPRTSRDTSP